MSCSTVKYFGVHIVSGRDIKFDLMLQYNVQVLSQVLSVVVVVVVVVCNMSVW